MTEPLRLDMTRLPDLAAAAAGSDPRADRMPIYVDLLPASP